MPDSDCLIEAAADSLTSCLEAQRGGAARIELCSALSAGGLTPSWALVESSRNHLRIPLFVLVRPREGDFILDEIELALVCREVTQLKSMGVDGIVFGALTTEGRVDESATRAVVETAGPLPVTFHRAFDIVADRTEALEAVIRSGCRRVLTSGGKSSIGDGLDAIRNTLIQAARRIGVVCGGRLDCNHLEDLYKLGVREFHLSGRLPVKSPLSSDLYEMDYFETSHSIIHGLADELHRIRNGN